MTNSLNFPNMIDVVRNRVATISDNQSIVNRSRLLILSDPTELYNEPDFGVGMKQFLWQYNTANMKSLICDKIKEQLALHEPACVAEETQYADGLLFTGGDDVETPDFNEIKMTVAIRTKLGDTATVDLSDLQAVIDQA